MTAIPQTPKRFKKWLDKQQAMDVPLWAEANLALRHMETFALNRNNRDLDAIKKLFQPQIDKFMADYAAWEQSKRR